MDFYENLNRPGIFPRCLLAEIDFPHSTFAQLLNNLLASGKGRARGQLFDGGLESFGWSEWRGCVQSKIVFDIGVVICHDK